MREEYNTPEMDVTIFGPKNVVATSGSDFVNPVLPDNDEDYEEDGW
ncbi:MAG: hypothetical protein IJE60_11710 [Tyzzerella sp.]|nr:hypothetical protein [Tyzzerella sp.]